MNTKATIDECLELLKQRKSDKVIQLLGPIISTEPDNFHVLQLLGLAYHLSGQVQTAIKLLERALAINPDFSAVQHNIAGVYRSLGDMQKAEDSYRKAISLKPDFAEAYQGLSEIIRFKNDDPLIAKIHEQLNKTDDDFLKKYFHFALGKIYDDCGDYEAAFNHYTKGNQLSENNWSTDNHKSYQQAIRKTYSEKYFQQQKAHGLESKIPVFIIGMPRSGSTLIEQILSSHSRVFAAGEISDIPNIANQLQGLIHSKHAYPFCIPEMSEKARKGLAKAYLNRITQIEGSYAEASRSIDKNLTNFNHLGLINDLFPNAFIIHIQRHPLDCCLSSYFQNFSNGVHWSFSMETIIGYYEGYHDMMQHWRKVLPAKFLDIKYENLVADPALISKEIISFCELPWEENCLNFHNNERTVKTASVWQVRQPIYKRSKARWQRYEQYISPLRQALSTQITEYEN